MHEFKNRSRLDLQMSKWYNSIPVQVARQKPNPTQSLTVESAAKGGVPVNSAYSILASVSSCAAFRALQAKDRNLDTSYVAVLLCLSSFIFFILLPELGLIVLTPAGINVLTNIEPQMTMRYSITLSATRRSLSAFKIGARPFDRNHENELHQRRQSFRKRGQA